MHEQERTVMYVLSSWLFQSPKLFQLANQAIDVYILPAFKEGVKNVIMKSVHKGDTPPPPFAKLIIVQKKLTD